MKILCDVCERAEAAVLCCADEASLCWNCDEKVHSANKVAGKHQRVPLLLPTAAFKMPICDICQEKAGYFFCLEDRALLCRHCDVEIHSASPFVSYHQRFLITGVRVPHQHAMINNSSSSSSATPNDLHNNSRSITNSSNSVGTVAPISFDWNKKFLLASASLGVEEPQHLSPPWPWNQVLEGDVFDQCFGLSEPGSSN